MHVFCTFYPLIYQHILTISILFFAQKIPHTNYYSQCGDSFYFTYSNVLLAGPVAM
nr:MAG TPA: hypothetical protein [Caudoviricetes sp.]